MNMSGSFFNTGPFMPHGGCYLWTQSLIALHATSDALIVLAYYSIPITLFYFVRKRKDLKFHWMFVCFAVFILACGTTHLMEIWNIWHANYWLSGAIKAITALASVPTAVLLVKLIPQALALPSPDALQKAYGEMERRVQERTAEQLQTTRNLEAEIVERAQAEEKLKVTLKEIGDLKAALDEHAIVAITDPQGKITYVNDKFCAISKFPREELLRQDHRIINSAYHSRDFIRDLWTTIGQGKVWKGEIKNRAKDGSFYWVDTTIVPFLNDDGKPRQYVAIRADITERKRAEDKLKASLKEIGDLKAALDEHAIVAITDPQGKITYVNDKFCAISKFPREELLGQDHRVINSRFHSKDFIRDLWLTITHGKVWKGEIKNRAKDGSYYWVDTTIVPFLNDDGKPRQYVAIRTDITERKAAEEKIRQLNIELEQRVSDRTAELEAFSYSVSHDLRAPVRAIGGFARMVQEDYGQQMPAEANRKLGRIHENAIQMGQLIDGLLTFSRLGRQALSRSKVQPSMIVRRILEGLQTEQADRHIQIMTADLPACQADPTLLQQVFANLISNAFKYTRQRDPAIIEIGWRNEDGQCVYFVKDNGAGFEMEYAHKLFGVFQRLHTAEQFEGTGVGLAIVQRIIHRHGGRIWAEAEPEKGALFSFTLSGKN